MQLDGSGVKEIFKIIKAPYILSTISLGSGLLLFLPDKLIKKIPTLITYLVFLTFIIDLIISIISKLDIN